MFQSLFVPRFTVSSIAIILHKFFLLLVYSAVRELTIQSLINSEVAKRIIDALLNVFEVTCPAQIIETSTKLYNN